MTRARQALAAGCDMLPVCNNRPSVIELLDRLDCEPQPASQPASGAPARPRSASDAGRSCRRLPEWQQARELLARMSSAPALTLDPGTAT